MNTTPRLTIAAFVLAAFNLCTTVVQAQFNYATNNGTITITGYTGPGGDVVIPGTISGLPVTSIGETAFWYCPSLIRVTIPNTVTNIGVSAFAFCPKLANVTIPNSVVGIEVWAFRQCPSLTSVTIPDGVINIGAYAFLACWNLTNVTIGNNVTTIGLGAFLSCTNLSSVTIGTNVTNIGDNAFSGCTGLTWVMIGSSVTNIGDGPFSDCVGLTNVTFGSGVTSIRNWTFSGCTNLTSLEVDALNPAYSSLDGVLFNRNQTTLIRCPTGRTGGYTAPASVASIEDSAFLNCASLTRLDLQGLGLTRLTLPTGLTNLKELRLARNMLSTLVLPRYLAGLTVLDLRENPLTTLILPERPAAILSPPIEDLVSRGVVVIAYPEESASHYVSVEGAHPVYPYTTWATAATNIQDAVDAAVAGDTVLVTNGVHAVGGKADEYGNVANRVIITNAIRLESVGGSAVTTIVGSVVLTNEFGEWIGREGGRCVIGVKIRNEETATLEWTTASFHAGSSGDAASAFRS